MKTFWILVLGFIFLTPLFGKAEVHLDAKAYHVQCNGNDAKNLLEAFKTAGAAVKYGTGKVEFYKVTGIDVHGHSNDVLDENDPCYKKPKYVVNFIDTNQDGKKITLDTPGCGETQAKALGKILGAMAGDRIADHAMAGEFEFLSSDFLITFNPKAKAGNKYAYSCSGSIGD